MSSTALVLVNKILRLTGDYKDVTTLANSPNGIARKIVEYYNMAISEIDTMTNWPRLRVNASGTTDGLTDVLTLASPEIMDVGSLVSVWIEGLGRLQEATADQFDELLATPTGLTAIASSAVTHFQRGVDVTGNVQVQLYPFPEAGLVVHTSGYQKATLLVNDSDTTQFDDHIILLGALAHLERFKGEDHGSFVIYRELLKNYYTSTFSNNLIRTQAESY